MPGQTLSEEDAWAALLDALDQEEEAEARAAVALALEGAAELTREWLRRQLEPVTTFRLSRDEGGEIGVALMRRPRAMCQPCAAVVRVGVPVEDPAACVDEISHAGEGAINAFLGDEDKRLAYVVFEGP